MKMVGPPSLQVFSVKSSTSSSTLIFVKFKTFVHTLIFSQLCRLVRAISRAKSTLVQILKENYQPVTMGFRKNKNKNKNKIFFGSFRLHYNWCSSSHVMPVPAFEGHFYYDSTWNSLISADEQREGSGVAPSDSPQLSGYLQWLEDRKVGGNSGVESEAEMNEIDKLAEMFIANCHEKFRLEKQESYRRFQEMMERSM